MIETDRIYLMDCMEGMKQIADSSVDAIIADLPYGVLNRSNPSVNWDPPDTVRSLVGAIPADYQAGQPHYPVRTGAFTPHGSCCRNPGYGGTTSCGRKIG